ncbi:hemerythrin domain-containing protein [Streptomyces sp. URMC 129]|uniref:hemerythrin domain-containing protein n=1 Tax=Streptomyces sp. URMC 129 TaxID=3423407 RepID=UPI003F1B26D9
MNPPMDSLPKAHQTMILAHRAMLRDLDRIARTAAALSAKPDAERVGHLRTYARRVTQIIEHHHQGEDEVLWPRLSERGADPAALKLLQQEHEELEESQTRLSEAIERLGEDGTGGDELSAAARATHDLLRTHTADEERELLDRLAPALDAALWKRFERDMVKSAPRWTLSFMPPWLSAVAEAGERGGVPALPVARLMRGRLLRRQQAAFGAQF